MIDKYEKKFNALLVLATEEALSQEFNDIPSLEELAEIYKPTPDMDKRIKRIIANRLRQKKAKAFLNVTGKTAAGFTIFFIISVAALLSVQASRNYLFNTFLSWHGNHATLEFQNSESVNEFDRYVFNYIPAGFKIKNSYFNDLKKTYVYTSDDGDSIILTQSITSAASDLQIDNEKNDFTLMKIHDQEAYFFESKAAGDMSTLIWEEGNITFEISSDLSGAQIILIAQNITKT